MIRTTSAILLLASLALLCGCSVFGIATKGELETALQQEAVQQRELESQLAALSAELDEARADLAAFDRRMRPRLASVDSALAANDAELEAATRQWTALQGALVSHLDSLRTEYVMLDRDMSVVREGMTTVSAQAARAQDDSRQAMRIHLETLVGQREHLLEQLQALDQRLEAWPADADTLAVPQEMAVAEPEVGKIDIRVVTPEEPVRGD